MKGRSAEIDQHAPPAPADPERSHEGTEQIRVHSGSRRIEAGPARRMNGQDDGPEHFERADLLRGPQRPLTERCLLVEMQHAVSRGPKVIRRSSTTRGAT